VQLGDQLQLYRDNGERLGHHLKGCTQQSRGRGVLDRGHGTTSRADAGGRLGGGSDESVRELIATKPGVVRLQCREIADGHPGSEIERCVDQPLPADPPGSGQRPAEADQEAAALVTGRTRHADDEIGDAVVGGVN
jgi:hypothetical protein